MTEMVDWDLAVSIGLPAGRAGARVSPPTRRPPPSPSSAPGPTGRPALVREFTGLDAARAHRAGARRGPARLDPGQRRRLRHRCSSPLVDKLQREEGPAAGRSPRRSAPRITGVEVGGAARLPRPARCSASSTRSTTGPATGAAAAGGAQHRPRRARARASTRTTSGCGSACTRRPTGCSSRPCRGCATTSAARSSSSSAPWTSTRQSRDARRAPSSGSATWSAATAERQPPRPVLHARAAGRHGPAHRRDVAARGARRRGDGRRRARR